MQKILVAVFAMFLLSNYANAKQIKTNPSDELTCLAKNIYYEAGSESYNAKLAVGYVTMNRVNFKIYPKTICGVVYQSCQFVWHCNEAVRKPYGPEWVESIQAAICVIEKCEPNKIPDVLFFHDDSIKFAFRCKKVEIVLISGKMIFYKYK